MSKDIPRNIHGKWCWLAWELDLWDIPETLRNIYLSRQLAPFSMHIPRDIPGNIPMLARAFRVLANVWMFPGISMEKRQKNGASLPERRISTGYSWKSRWYPLSTQLALFFSFFSTIIPRNILTLVMAFSSKRVSLSYSICPPNKGRILRILMSNAIRYGGPSS